MRAFFSNPGIRSMAIAVVVIVLAATWLRFADLGQMPFHADEAATGAQTLAYRLGSSGYEFDPSHHHGPLLTALAEPWCRFKGETDWESLTAVTLRQFVAAGGLLTVLGVLALTLGMRMGWPRATIALALTATSPLLVYYSRVFIHEPVFLFFAVPSLVGLLWLLSGRRPWLAACALGVGIGGMAATRETVVVSLFAWSVAGILYAWRESSSNNVVSMATGLAGRLWKPLLLAAALTLAIIFWFYSAGGTQLSGFLGFFATYFEYETGEGHDKPFAYYLELLVWPKELIGRWWSEAGVFVLALCVYLDRRKETPSPMGRFFFEAGALHLFAFSLIAYKTPWLVCLGWFHLCIAAGFGGVTLIHLFPGAWRAVPVFGVVAIAAWQGVQAKRAAFRLASDARNPYAYVPTSKDVVGLAGLLEDLRGAMPGATRDPVAVIGEQYWPLPWYLRQSGPVGYWDVLPEDGARLPLLLILPSAAEDAGTALAGTHTFLPRGLRDEFPVMVAVRNDVWKAYQAR